MSKKKTEKAKPERLQSTVTLRLLRPVSGTWDEAGNDLHAIKGLMHRIVQAATLETIIAVQEGRKADACGRIKEELSEIAEHTKNPHTKEWASPSVLASSVRDAVQVRARKEALNYLRKRHKQPMKIPSARYPAPIYVRDGRWRVEKDGTLLRLSIKLRGGRAEWHQFVCAGVKGHHWQLIRGVANKLPGYKPGDLKLVYDKRKDRRTGRKRGWEARVAIGWPKPEPANGDNVLAVHRGRHNFLYYAVADGPARALVGGDALQEMKLRVRARRRKLRRHLREVGRGARGHGTERRLQTYRALGDYEARYIKTLCQQTAARVVQIAESRGCALVIREDYGGIPDQGDGRFLDSFPYFQLAQTIDWACEKAGIAVETVPAEYVSTTCFQCGHNDERNHSHRTGTFRCTACGLAREADFVAALNMLYRSGLANMSAWEAKFKALSELENAVKTMASAAQN